MKPPAAPQIPCGTFAPGVVVVVVFSRHSSRLLPDARGTLSERARSVQIHLRVSASRPLKSLTHETTRNSRVNDAFSTDPARYSR